jgi:hypothetical protein
MNSFTDTPNEKSVVARLTGCVLENAWFEAGEVAINEPSQCFDEKRSRSMTVAPTSAPKLDEGMKQTMKSRLQINAVRADSEILTLRGKSATAFRSRR